MWLQYEKCQLIKKFLFNEFQKFIPNEILGIITQ